jgi:hypothetical protein
LALALVRDVHFLRLQPISTGWRSFPQRQAESNAEHAKAPRKGMDF